MALETDTVTGTFVGLDGEPCTGTMTFTPPCVVRDNTNQVIMSGPVSVPLDPAGHFTIELPCTEQDGLDPAGFSYQVTQRLDCADCIVQYPITLSCETAPAPRPYARARCTDDGHTVSVTVIDALWPITVDWGDGSAPEEFSRGETVRHAYYQDGDPLDPTRPAAPLLGGPVPLSQPTAHQQANTDPLGGEWYATQLMDSGIQLDDEPAPVPWSERSCDADIAINRLTAAGDLMSHMYVRRFDHGSGLGIERVDDSTLYLWTGVDARRCSPPGRNGLALKIGRYPYEADAVYDVDDPQVEIFDPLPGFKWLTPAIDMTHNTIGVEYNVAPAGAPEPDLHVKVWDLDDFKAHNFSRPLYDTQVPYHWGHQAWTLYGRYYYEFNGQPPHGDIHFYVTDLTTGTEIRADLNTQYEEFDYREPESILVRETADGPQLVWGLAVGNPRRMALFAGEPHRTAQDVTITVTDAYGNTVDVTGVDHIPCED